MNIPYTVVGLDEDAGDSEYERSFIEWVDAASSTSACILAAQARAARGYVIGTVLAVFPGHRDSDLDRDAWLTAYYRNLSAWIKLAEATLA